MASEMKFKVGDRVRVYGGAFVEVAVIRSIDADTGILSCGQRKGTNEWLMAHPKQCRRLVKKPRRRVWINPWAITQMNTETFGKDIARALTDKANTEWIEFREVRRK